MPVWYDDLPADSRKYCMRGNKQKWKVSDCIKMITGLDKQLSCNGARTYPQSVAQLTGKCAISFLFAFLVLRQLANLVTRGERCFIILYMYGRILVFLVSSREHDRMR